MQADKWIKVVETQTWLGFSFDVNDHQKHFHLFVAQNYGVLSCDREDTREPSKEPLMHTHIRFASPMFFLWKKNFPSKTSDKSATASLWKEHDHGLWLPIKGISWDIHSNIGTYLRKKKR